MSASENKLFNAYQKIKGKYPDAVVLLRTGDNYITYNSDATLVCSVCNIITDKSYELTFPATQLDNILSAVVKSGKRVAVADQLPKPALKKSEFNPVLENMVKGLAATTATENTPQLKFKFNR